LLNQSLKTEKYQKNLAKTQLALYIGFKGRQQEIIESNTFYNSNIV